VSSVLTATPGSVGGDYSSRAGLPIELSLGGKADIADASTVDAVRLLLRISSGGLESLGEVILSGGL
jgi:hypothetical protein